MKKYLLVVTTYLFLFLFPITGYSSESSIKGNGDFLSTIFFILVSAFIGYFIGAIGAAKAFREEKQKAYGEILSPIFKMAYHPEDSVDEKEFSRALSKVWLFGNKEVAKKIDYAVSILHRGSGNIMEAFQEAVVEMSKDIQFWPWQKLEPKDVRHLYTRVRKN